MIGRNFRFITVMSSKVSNLLVLAVPQRHAGVMKGTYIGTTDNTLRDLSQFHDFLYRIFHNYERYKDVQPDSNQPALFCLKNKLFLGKYKKFFLWAENFFLGRNFFV